MRSRLRVPHTRRLNLGSAGIVAGTCRKGVNPDEIDYTILQPFEGCVDAQTTNFALN